MIHLIRPFHGLKSKAVTGGVVLSLVALGVVVTTTLIVSVVTLSAEWFSIVYGR